MCSNLFLFDEKSMVSGLLNGFVLKGSVLSALLISWWQFFSRLRGTVSFTKTHISDISFPGLPMILNQQKSLSSWILVAFNMVGKTATSIDSIIDIHESPILKVFSCQSFQKIRVLLPWWSSYWKLERRNFFAEYWSFILNFFCRCHARSSVYLNEICINANYIYDGRRPFAGGWSLTRPLFSCY